MLTTAEPRNAETSLAFTTLPHPAPTSAAARPAATAGHHQVWLLPGAHGCQRQPTGELPAHTGGRAGTNPVVRPHSCCAHPALEPVPSSADSAAQSAQKSAKPAIVCGPGQSSVVGVLPSPCRGLWQQCLRTERGGRPSDRGARKVRALCHVRARLAVAPPLVPRAAGCRVQRASCRRVGMRPPLPVGGSACTAGAAAYAPSKPSASLTGPRPLLQLSSSCYTHRPTQLATPSSALRQPSSPPPPCPTPLALCRRQCAAPRSGRRICAAGRLPPAGARAGRGLAAAPGKREAVLQGFSGHIGSGQRQLQQCWQAYACTHMRAPGDPLCSPGRCARQPPSAPTLQTLRGSACPAAARALPAAASPPSPTALSRCEGCGWGGSRGELDA